MERVLISGGAGFIGSHLAESLHNDGYHVTVADNLCTGKIENLKMLLDRPNFIFKEADVCKMNDYGPHFDYVFHLASPASPVDYQKLSVQTMSVNSLGTEMMLNWALSRNARFLYTSTSEVYGDPKIHPQHEEYWGNVNPNGIRSCYDESKRYGEAMTMIYNRESGVDTRIARIFNTYGPRMKMDDGRVVPSFITQALNNKPMTIYGDGKQTRSYCYVSDMVDGLKRLMFTDGLSGEVVNLGNPEEYYSVIGLARVIQSITNSKSEFVPMDLPKDDPKRRKPDIRKAHRLLGWEPSVDIDEGLRKTIEWFRS